MNILAVNSSPRRRLFVNIRITMHDTADSAFKFLFLEPPTP
jgi:hypothetical protein